jgi:hypothetical protein
MFVLCRLLNLYSFIIIPKYVIQVLLIPYSYFHVREENFISIICLMKFAYDNPIVTNKTGNERSHTTYIDTFTDIDYVEKKSFVKQIVVSF